MKPGLRTIEQEWQSLAKEIFDLADFAPSDAQQIEMQKAFYAGAFAMICGLERIGEPDISEADALAWIEARKEEVRQFVEKL